MSKEGRGVSPEVATVLEALEKQANKVSFKLDFSRTLRITSGDVKAIEAFMAHCPNAQELIIKGHFYQIDYINKTFQILSRQNLIRLLLTINTNRSLQPLVFTKELITSFCNNFKSRIFPKLSTFGLYKAVFASPELIPMYIAGLQNIYLTSMHLSLLENTSPQISTSVAEKIAISLRNLKYLHKFALINMRLGQQEACTFVDAITRPYNGLSSPSHLYIGLLGSDNEKDQNSHRSHRSIIDPTSIAVNFLKGIQNILSTEDRHIITEAGISVLITMTGYQRLNLTYESELKDTIGAIIFSLCEEKIEAKNPTSQKAVHSLIKDVISRISIRFEADGPIEITASSLTKRISESIETNRNDIASEILKGFGGQGNKQNGMYSGTDSYGNSDGYGAKSKSKSKQQAAEREDQLFGSFCSSSPISDDIDEEDLTEYTNSSDYSSDNGVQQSKIGTGGRPVFSSNGAMWEYNRSSLILDNILTFVAHCEQNSIAFDTCLNKSQKPLEDDDRLERRSQIYKTLIEGQKIENEHEKILLYESIQPDIIDLFQQKASVFTIECFTDLKSMIKMLSSTPKNVIGSTIPPSLTKGKGYMYVVLVN